MIHFRPFRAQVILKKVTKINNILLTIKFIIIFGRD